MSRRAMVPPHTGWHRGAMNSHAPSPGTTLIELVFALTLLAILCGLAYPPLQQGLDRYAVRSARDALASGVARARAVAVARSGADLVVDVAAARFWIEAAPGDTVGAPVDLAARYRVRFTVDGAAADRVALHFDGLGLGRLANRTFRLRRGGAEANLTLSSFGRPRRW